MLDAELDKGVLALFVDLVVRRQCGTGAQQQGACGQAQYGLFQHSNLHKSKG
ncbi:hypothetical protein M8494_15245 [Serratia ureilytica]